MEEEKLMEESTSRWGNKTLITIFVTIVLGTNALNRYVSNQEKNTITIEYNKERGDKKDERVKQDALAAIETNNLKQEIIRLTRELEKYKNK